MFDEGRLTIPVVPLHNAPHDAPHDGPHISFQEHVLTGNNDVLHRCHIWCQRTVGATTHFPSFFAIHQQVINKVMIEHSSNEILTHSCRRRHFDACDSCGPPISLLDCKMSILRYVCFIYLSRAGKSMKWNRYNEILTFCYRVVKYALDTSRHIVSDLDAQCQYFVRGVLNHDLFEESRRELRCE